MKQLITLSLVAIALLVAGCMEEGKNDKATASQDKVTKAASQEATDTKKP